MCVLKIEKNLVRLEGVKNIQNISYYHCVDFKENGGVYWEYYEIGEGKFYPFSDIKFINSSSLVVDWRSSDKQEESMTTDNRKKYKCFPCPEVLCVLELIDENEMLSHVSSGRHQFAKTKTGMDKAILYYAKRKHMQNAIIEPSTSICIDKVDVVSNYSQIYIQGWARKVRRVRKMSAKQKEFIEKLFKDRTASKVKLSAEQMAQAMKSEMLNGDYYFRPEECLDPKRIRGLITRFKKSQHSTPARKLQTVLEYDGIESNIEDICDSVFNFDSEEDE